ncbi:hypothetical protein ATANTOWER_030106 [Ataeniobius toweri]|uniref:Uncharacterized protein n=1 Tax=Ataeniobius toweri TaxID=208326 RepID=A0ABU7C9W2_9TELE|nr:hypothetical protein [Ataeniobius toweri]
MKVMERTPGEQSSNQSKRVLLLKSTMLGKFCWRLALKISRTRTSTRHIWLQHLCLLHTLKLGGTNIC